MKTEARNRIEQSNLTPESKQLWHSVLEANDDSFAEQFMKDVGGDEKTLEMATKLLHARSNSKEAVEAGTVTENEQQVIETLQDEQQ